MGVTLCHSYKDTQETQNVLTRKQWLLLTNGVNSEFLIKWENYGFLEILGNKEQKYGCGVFLQPPKL